MLAENFCEKDDQGQLCLRDGVNPYENEDETLFNNATNDVNETSHEKKQDQTPDNEATVEVE